MATLKVITDLLNERLDADSYKDASLNGLQVESDRDEVKTVALAVDAGESIIAKAVEAGAELLIVHHGLFWNDVQPITGPLGRKIASLQGGGCSLYASHLPLDGSKDYGNAFEMARALEIGNLLPFCELDGKTLGVQGMFNKPLSIEDVENLLVEALNLSASNYYPFTLPFGKEKVQSVSIATGSGAFGVQLAADAGHDIYISGEPKHEVYHMTKELKMNAIFGGHYATETFGVKALGRLLEKEFSVSTVFLDEPSGI